MQRSIVREFTSMLLSVCAMSALRSRLTSLEPPSKHAKISRMDVSTMSCAHFICTSCTHSITSNANVLRH